MNGALGTAADANAIVGAAVRAAFGRPVVKRPLWLKVLPVGLLAPLLFVVGLVAGCPSADPLCAAQPGVIYDGDLARVLSTIRTLESAGNYEAQAADRRRRAPTSSSTTPGPATSQTR